MNMHDAVPFLKRIAQGYGGFRILRTAFTREAALLGLLGALFAFLFGLLAWDAYLFFFHTPRLSDDAVIPLRGSAITQEDIERAVGVLDERKARMEEILQTLRRE